MFFLVFVCLHGHCCLSLFLCMFAQQIGPPAILFCFHLLYVCFCFVLCLCICVSVFVCFLFWGSCVKLYSWYLFSVYCKKGFGKQPLLYSVNFLVFVCSVVVIFHVSINLGLSKHIVLGTQFKRYFCMF